MKLKSELILLLIATFFSVPIAPVPAQELNEVAMDTLMAAEHAYWNHDDRECQRILQEFWEKYPPSSQKWNECKNPQPEVFTGTPPCYYALRMMTEVADWKVRCLDQEGPRISPATVQLTVVLVGLTEGVEPQIKLDLERGKGEVVQHKLDNKLLQNKNQIIRESLRLFQAYVLAMTDGKLQVKLNFVSRPALRVGVKTTFKPKMAGLDDGAMDLIWAAMPDKVRLNTDWWWVIYPSHVPEHRPDFKRTEFITGGMGVGPDGASPCFIVDDRWLLRKPPHLGVGAWTEKERRAYLPQWLQHELFHHLFRIYPEFDLEKRGHQWFDLSTWPADFNGHFEADYYFEALQKRLKQATPPMHIKLRHVPPSAKLFRNLSTDDFIGYYRHSPVENDWHLGTISNSGSRDKGKAVLLWRNSAGVSWKLIADLKKGYLRTTEDNPYWESVSSPRRDFRVVLDRDDKGEYLPRIAGFQFMGSFYALSKPD